MTIPTKGFTVLILLFATLSYAQDLGFLQTPTVSTPATVRDDQDWADLGRYAASDAELSVLPAGTNQVVFMGDSITDWWNLTQFFPGKPYVDRGIAGQTTPQMLVRFRPDVVDLQPNVTVILGGTNDLAKKTGDEPLDIIEGNLISMAELARNHGIKVVLGSLLPVCGKVIFIRDPLVILKMNKFIKDYCEQIGAVYVDYHSALVGIDGLFKKDLTIDCLHPNAAGYAIMAPLAEAAIQQALQQNSSSIYI